MLKLPTLLLGIALLPLAGCFDDPADEVAIQQASGPPPGEVCTEVRGALDTMTEKGAIDYQDDGTAVMEESLWMRMGADGRDKIGQMLAFHAACAAKAGSASQRIVIRNAFGNVMMQRNFDTRMNTVSMFGD
ncbi:hypothetical protein [Sphingosinicella rhizophila]|uniref:Lipoprotein n=1 Tax=Sphingosinicella rhizophila TaxID=3050082 RepID=A0ABU3Q8Q6_9SPHN|nr:hypothetical protein [Sphingosinicella sp. GR2756]MDT9599790.1 hypothetical protein [Sphingosinicella sp. GR2756]